MKDNERIVSYVKPNEKEFIEKLHGATTLSQSAIIAHSIKQMQSKFNYLHGLPPKQRLIEIIKSYNLYCGDGGVTKDGVHIIKFGDKVFQAKHFFDQDFIIDAVSRKLHNIYEGYTESYRSGNMSSLPRYIMLLPLIINDLKIYSAEIDA